jgi:FkbM family methyltransferase
MTGASIVPESTPNRSEDRAAYDDRVIQTPFVSYAQNAEDVVLRRALGSVSAGRYVEVGANHPRHDSATRAFYDRGWSGITIEPVPYFADLQRAERPRDHLVQAAITNSGRGEVTLHVVAGTGLSTTVDAVSNGHAQAGIEHVDLVVPTIRLDDVLADSGWTGQDIHFMLIDVEGAERDVLASVDLKRWRPWVLVVESTAPTSTVTTYGDWEPELLARGYEYCLFDGVSRFYVAAEKSDLLRAALSYPACVWDNYQTLSQITAIRERAELLEQTGHWRTIALTHWADAVSQGVRMSRNARQDSELSQARKQLVAIQSTVSWRLTRPLRGVRRVIDRVRR